jgi:hypothetical protein
MSVLGGALGGWAGMLIWRHKINHPELLARPGRRDDRDRRRARAAVNGRGALGRPVSPAPGPGAVAGCVMRQARTAACARCRRPPCRP